MQIKPKISVVVPAYNEEKFIGRCLKALRAQRFRDYEIIVVDNSSTDATAEIAANYADRVLYEERKGVAYARQRGFMEAKGHIIASTDADTIVGENWLNEISRGLDNLNLICIYGPVYLLDGLSWEKAAAKYGFTAFLKISHFLGIPNITGMNFAVKNEAFHDAGGFDLNVKSAEDVTLALKLKRIGKIGFNPKMVVYTSARRLKAGRWEFFKHHTLNYLSVVLRRKTRAFEDIR